MTQRKYACLVLMPLMALHAGCQSVQLERHAIRQARTLTDLQYKLVLDNFAMLATNPSALPFYSSAGTGLTNIQQSGQASFSPSADLLLNPAKTLYRYYSDKFGYGVQGSQTNLEQWTTASVLNPDELDLMRCVYRKTLGFSDAKCEHDLGSYFAGKPELLAAMRRGWLCVGGRGEHPPKEAAYVGHDGTIYVWVMPGAVESLTRITLAILDIATAVQPGGGPSRVNPTADRIKVLQDQATALGAISDKNPGKQNSPMTALVGRQIDSLLSQILLLEGVPSGEIVAALGKKIKTETLANALHARAAKMGISELLALPTDLANGSAEVEAEKAARRVAQDVVANAYRLNAVLAANDESLTQPVWRQRKNLYNPNVIPIGANIP